MPRAFAILGQRLLAHNRLPPLLIGRLERLPTHRPGDIILVCGGNVCGKQCTHSEAYVMRNYLMRKHNIPRNAILLENRSRSTLGNIRRLNALCDRHDIRQLTLITSGWHLPRVRALCARFLTPAVTFRPSHDRISARQAASEKRKLAALR